MATLLFVGRLVDFGGGGFEIKKARGSFIFKIRREEL